jgi:hypothetical protein
MRCEGSAASDEDVTLPVAPPVAPVRLRLRRASWSFTTGRLAASTAAASYVLSMRHRPPSESRRTTEPLDMWLPGRSPSPKAEPTRLVPLRLAPLCTSS